MPKRRKRRTEKDVCFTAIRAKSIYERIESELENKDRKYLIKRLEKLGRVIKQSDRKLKYSYYPSKILEEIRFWKYLYPYLVGEADAFPNEISDYELRLAIQVVETAMRNDSKREIKSAELQDKNRFKGKQKGRAYKSYHDH